MVKECNQENLLVEYLDKILFLPSLVTMQANSAFKTNDREREFFMKTLIHDLKVPTIAQLRGIELLRQETLGMLNVEQKGLISEIIKSCNYVLEMISTIIYAYRLDIGELELSYSSFSVENLFNECIMSIHSKIENLPQIHLEIQPNNTMIYADKEALKIALSNMILNVMIKHNIIQNLSIKVDTIDNFIEFTISSDCYDICSKNFVPFRDILNNLKYTTVGYGVDLYLCNKIIELHNGRVYADVANTNINMFSFIIPNITASRDFFLENEVNLIQ